MTTVVTWHAACRLHQAGAGHPERPGRIEAVLEALREPALTAAVEWVEAAPVTRAQLARVHPAAYLDGLESLAAAGGGTLDADTTLGPRSWDSVLASAGVAVAAVERGVVAGTAFGATRPPRAARAGAARRVSRRTRVARGGRGGYARRGSHAGTTVVSMHQFPWYPGTGAADERGVGNVFNVPRPPGLPRHVYARDLLAAVDAALDGWRADVVLISAGFDSLHGDPLGGFTLEPDDITALTVALRERAGGAPVVGLLEGGYRLDLLAAGAAAHVQALA